ncbi:aminotransferase class IV family protein [Tabrizicola sp.]|uniref:aminotransferase class IV family protein n=1 Tax=Tabrizicola sp. TaxID=2005166 RepID=UPI001A4C5A7B|nr:aminotransferase class IV family protein [Tabrizicola sp.]MBL9074675.1 aminotransferase class IV family protein [Tabrizicola sp.]
MGGGAVEGALREGGGEPGLKLIETVLWDGERFPRIMGHLDRLNRSRALLGWARPGVGFFWKCDLTLPKEPARVRLTVDASGKAEWQMAALPPPKAEWRVGLAAERLRSDDPWLRVKSTRREAYDRARAALPERLDEVLFLNERGEVCEGTITNVFFDRGQGLRTPPLSCGLLPGVLRADLACPEEVLMADDLPKVRLWVGNALRGLIPAVFILG